MQKRFDSLKNPLWTAAMIVQIGAKKNPFFRWHDSGDIQGDWHLQNIVHIALALPYIKFWLPTREYTIVEQYMGKHTIPENLTIRLSSYMIEGEPPTAIAKRLGLPTSGVSESSYNCPAPQQNNYCGSCRACWDSSVENINYRKH
jgi:hypothetical protein